MRTPTDRSRGPSRIARVFTGLAWALVFALACAIGALLHADLPVVRSALIETLNGALSGKFRGQVSLSGLERLSASGATLRELQIRAEPSGVPLLSLEGVRIEFQPLRWLASLWPGSISPLALERVTVDHVEVRLIEDASSGQWTLLRALESPKPPRVSRPHVARGYAIGALEVGSLELWSALPGVGALHAEVSQLRASGEVGNEHGALRVDPFAVRVAAGDKLTFSGTGSLELQSNAQLVSKWRGSLDGTPLVMQLGVAGSRLELTLDMPEVRPDVVRAILPAWPLQSPIAAHLEAEGPPASTQVTASVIAGTSRLDARGEVALDALSARLTLSAQHLDARLFAPTLPQTAVDARAELQLGKGAAGLELHAQGTTEPTPVASIPLPATQFKVDAQGSKLEGNWELGDARGHFTVHVSTSAASPLELDVRGDRVDLGSWPQFGTRWGGRTTLEAHAQLDQGRLEGKLNGQLSALRTPGLEIADGHFAASVRGPVDAWPTLPLVTSFSGHDLRIGSLVLEQAEWSSRGGGSRSKFEARLTTPIGGTGRVRGSLELTPRLSFEALEGSWAERDLKLSARASRFTPSLALLHVEAFALSGAAGKLRGAVRLEPEGLAELRADAEQLDTGRLARKFGVATGGFEAKVTGHAELSHDRALTRGNVDVQLAELNLRELAVGTLNVQATLQDQRLVATLGSTNSPFGRFDSRATVVLGGPVLALDSWKRATGEGSLTLDQVPLWPVGLLLPKQGPVQDLNGRAKLSLQVQRADPRDAPSAFLQASTSELAFTLPAEAGADAPPVTFDRLALHASATLDGPSGHGAATVSFTDAHGALVTTSGSLVLDLPALLANPELALEQLWRTPLDALVHLHPRPISDLPPPLGRGDLPGKVEGTLQLTGTLADPQLQLSLEGRELFGNLIAGAASANVDVRARFAPRTGQLNAQAEARSQDQGLVSARFEGTLTGSPKTGWALGDLHAAALVNGVPLELWPAAARQDIRARLFGGVAIDQRAGKLDERGHLALRDLSIAGHPLGDGTVTLSNDARGARAQLRLGSREHQLRAELRRAEPIGADADGPGYEGSITTSDFDAASLSPLVTGILSHLDGAVDADLKFRLQPRTSAPAFLGIDGEARVKHGQAHLDSFGLDLNDVSGRVRAESASDHTNIVIDPVSASSRSRTPNLTGNATLRLEGVRVANGDAHLDLKDVLLSLKGAARGTARGRIDAQLVRERDTLAVQVSVPELRLRLPDTSSRSLISLESNPDIRVGETALPTTTESGNNLLWKVAFQLGNAVRLERTDLRLPLGGEPQLDYGEQLRPSGTLETLPGASIQLFDQTFSVDHGSLRFVPDDPSNPVLDVTASWRAADGTTIYVDITGPIDDARVTTRDDRGLQDADRFYLLTGNPAATTSVASEPTEFTENGTGDRTAIGQTFALGINQLLRGSLGNVAVSIGTTPDARASYSASVRLSDRLFFQGSYSPASENSRAQTTNDITGTLDYQLSRAWSLRTELGTTGGALDLLWSHRY